MALRRVRVADPDAVWFRSVLECYEGLASWHADGSGIYLLSAPPGRASELDALLADLAREGAVLPLPAGPER